MREKYSRQRCFPFKGASSALHGAGRFTAGGQTAADFKRQSRPHEIKRDVCWRIEEIWNN